MELIGLWVLHKLLVVNSLGSRHIASAAIYAFAIVTIIIIMT